MKALATSCLLMTVVLASCGDATTTSATTAIPGTTVAPTTTLAPTSSTTAPATTIPATTTTVAPVTTHSLVDALPTLDDGRPASFMAVTDQYEAVEVGTVSGAVLERFGQYGTPADFGREREIAPNVVDAVWRTTDGRWVIVSECCEPAAGVIHYLAPGEQLSPDRNGLNTFGWFVAPSPRSGDVAVIGYSLRVGAVGEDGWAEPIDQGDSFPAGMPSWGRDGERVYWLATRGDGAWVLRNVEPPAVPDPATDVVLEWLDGDDWLDGIGTQASGRLVAFVQSGAGETDGVVFAPDGELVATFPVEDGSRFGGYDPSGRFLIYTDGDDRVRWQGLGRSGILGEGYYFASW